MIRSGIQTSLVLLIVFTLLTGVLYPLAVSGIAELLFAEKAGGSLVRKGDRVVGSALIGQSFTDPRYFWGRPSATVPFPYNPSSSGGSNYGPLNPALIAAAEKRISDLRAADPGNRQPVPVDLVTASGSGLDPHISIAAALYQLPRVARVRGIRADEVRSLVDQATEGRQWGILGEPRVNVLKLNLALDAFQSSQRGANG